MRKVTNKYSGKMIALYLSGLIPVVWLALKSAPYFIKNGLVGILENAGDIFNNPFHITLVRGSLRVTLIFCVLYAIGIGIYLSTERNFRRREEHGSAKWADNYGFKGIIAEGWDKILESRTPNKVYRPDGCRNIKLLTKNYRLSDDIAFRFPNKSWNEWPLTVDKYLRWLNTACTQGPIVNLFMDFETFGENVWKDTGIFEFFEDLIHRWNNNADCNFMTVSEACDSSEPGDSVSMPWTVTWADTERDLSAWLGNSMQHEALKAIYDLKPGVLASNDEDLITDRLLTSDHLYYMSTKHLNDGGVHQYFSPYDSPFDAFLYFMNAVRDVRGRVEAYLPKSEKSREE